MKIWLTREAQITFKDRCKQFYWTPCILTPRWWRCGPGCRLQCLLCRPAAASPGNKVDIIDINIDIIDINIDVIDINSMAHLAGVKGEGCQVRDTSSCPSCQQLQAKAGPSWSWSWWCSCRWSLGGQMLSGYNISVEDNLCSPSWQQWRVSEPRGLEMVCCWMSPLPPYLLVVDIVDIVDFVDI